MSFVLLSAPVLVLTKSLGLTLGVALGPFAGGFARDWQSCCKTNSLTIFPFTIAIILAALGLRSVLRGRSKPIRILRHLLTWIAPMTWFLAALLSYAHALE
ncbi:MAG: hypothetical protein H6830_11980 [Planctomycetes bacterium]|nr:hypothetical protein [Planctomycetota bacterium]MCB9909820.1 hypothetical protein [Planctomycetota bacterium]MCB9912270.1 hypothetical protein [Planctomycetota bacterium]HPF13511.1 hypothetical protein [Planctomycetota bacterium]